MPCPGGKDASHVGMETRKGKQEDNIEKSILRILAMYEAKNSKTCNFWTFWPVFMTM